MCGLALHFCLFKITKFAVLIYLKDSDKKCSLMYFSFFNLQRLYQDNVTSDVVSQLQIYKIVYSDKKIHGKALK